MIFGACEGLACASLGKTLPLRLDLALATAGVRQRNKEETNGQRRKVAMDLLRIVLAVLLPPLGVFLQVGIGKHFWINILLTILGYIPGIIHAVWVIAKY